MSTPQPQPQPDATTHDRFLAEANAELDAMLGEVGVVEPPPPPAAKRNWVQLLLIAAIALAVLVIGMVLLRGRRSGRMTLNLVR